MPPTSEPDAGDVLIDGLEAFGLEELAPLLERAARAALVGQDAVDPADAEISLAFVDDPAIAELNVRWLGRAGPTDVISFGLGADPLVADVYVSVDTARRNAAELHVPPREELARLVVHGVLHAAGLDHPEDDGRAASPMFALQEKILSRLLTGLPER